MAADPVVEAGPQWLIRWLCRRPAKRRERRGQSAAQLLVLMARSMCHNGFDDTRERSMPERLDIPCRTSDSEELVVFGLARGERMRCRARDGRGSSCAARRWNIVSRSGRACGCASSNGSARSGPYAEGSGIRQKM
ncbi:hypothetical protein GCM10009764_41080 [Nocardia ninae]|uniref:Uncharacterized protein n=1 Tax=Nocardia ninae NBRC 108245 TaxID=1210091 RepID=A0A511MAI7_9NOCA|nr:hypothetical protein NN4_21390 [Nocardia ninae NBRC 108245]